MTDPLDVFAPPRERLAVAGAEVEIGPATLRQLPALRGLGALAAEILAAPDLGAAAEQHAAALAQRLERLTGIPEAAWLDAPWGEAVAAMVAVLRVNNAYLTGPFAERIAAETARIRAPAGES
jgi:hypothetical protein